MITTPFIISVVGAKGGVGTSSFTVALALAAVNDGKRVCIIGDTADAAAIIGLAHKPADGMALDVVPRLDLFDNMPPDRWMEDHQYDLVLSADPDLPHDTRLLVIRGCYLALRRAVTSDIAADADAAVLFMEKERALGKPDVEDVLGIPVMVTVPVQPSVARAIDSGTLTVRDTVLAKAAAQVFAKIGAIR